MLCPNCGNQIDDHSSSCPYCGYSFGYNGDTVLLNNQGYNNQYSNNDPYSGQYNGQYQGQYSNQYQDQFQNNFGQYNDQSQNSFGQYNDQSQNSFGQYNDQSQNSFGQYNDQYQNSYNQYNDQSQNGYGQYNDQYQNGYNQYNEQYQSGYDQYGYQDPYYNNVQPKKKKHTVLKTVLILVLVVAVAFGGYKGWGIISKRMGSEAPTDVAVTASSEQLQALEDLEALLEETNTYVGENVCGAEDTDGAEACEQLHIYYDQFKKMKNLPENLRGATDTFYTATISIYEVYYTNEAFYDEFAEVTEQIAQIQVIASYDDAVAYYESNMQLINSIKLQLAGLDVPPGYTSIVTNISDKITILENYMQEIGVGVSFDDNVRILGGLSVGGYFFEKTANEISEFADYINYTADTYEAQAEKIGSLFDEIGEALELDYSELVTYEFQNVTDKIVFNYDAVDTIYPSLYNSYDYFLLLKTSCTLGAQDIIVECKIDGLTETYKQTYHVTNDILFLPIKPAADTTIMSDITASDVDMTVNITTKDGTVLDTQTFPVHIADQNDLEFYEEDFGFSNGVSTLCYLTPSSESVGNLKRNAIDILSTLTDGAMNSFAGYQGPMMGATYIDTYYYSASVMLSLQQSGITLTSETYDMRATSQTIQFPEETISSGSGSAMDVALVIASALTSADMNAYIVMSGDHVYVLLETWSQDCMYLLLDPTKINADMSLYDESGRAIMQQTILMGSEYPIHVVNDEIWNTYINNDSILIINCSDGSILGLAPFAH